MHLRKRQMENPSKLNVEVLVIHGKNFSLDCSLSILSKVIRRREIYKKVFLIVLSTVIVRHLRKMPTFITLRKVEAASYEMSADSGW